MIRLEELLPQLRRNRQDLTDSERITELELAIHYLKSRVAQLESRGQDE